MIADAIRAMSKLPEPVLGQLGSMPYSALQALAAWLSAEDDTPEPTDALERLPAALKSELALARMQERAAKG